MGQGALPKPGVKWWLMGLYSSKRGVVTILFLLVAGAPGLLAVGSQQKKHGNEHHRTGAGRGVVVSFPFFFLCVRARTPARPHAPVFLGIGPPCGEVFWRAGSPTGPDFWPLAL